MPHSRARADVVSTRRTPDIIALEILSCIDVKGYAFKWDLIKILGNEVQFKKWVDEFFIIEEVITERKEGRNYFYEKTPHGELFHQFLKQRNIIKLFSRISGKRLRS